MHPIWWTMVHKDASKWDRSYKGSTGLGFSCLQHTAWLACCYFPSHHTFHCTIFRPHHVTLLPISLSGNFYFHNSVAQKMSVQILSPDNKNMHWLKCMLVGILTAACVWCCWAAVGSSRCRADGMKRESGCSSLCDIKICFLSRLLYFSSSTQIHSDQWIGETNLANLLTLLLLK